MGRSLQSSPSAAMVPTLREMRLEDYGAIRKLALENCVAISSVEDWEYRWLQNPVWRSFNGALPIGWVLETEGGEIVGSMESVPVRYTLRGNDLVSAASALWCVSAPYRGFALQLLAEYFAQPVDLFISTTAGPDAVESLKHMCDPVPEGRWDMTACFVVHPRSFSETALRRFRVPLATQLSYPISGVLRLAKALSSKGLPAAPKDVAFEAAAGFDSRFDVFWDELVRQNPERLMADRSSAALSWHFARALRTQRLWIFTATRRQRLVGYCIFAENPVDPKNMYLMDYQSVDDEADLLPGFIRIALRRGAAEGVSTLKHIGTELPRFAAFDKYASYQRRMECWTFFFSAADQKLDAELHHPHLWDPSAYDGDASL